jgi:hypothetical protein
MWLMAYHACIFNLSLPFSVRIFSSAQPALSLGPRLQAPSIIRNARIAPSPLTPASTIHI